MIAFFLKDKVNILLSQTPSGALSSCPGLFAIVAKGGLICLKAIYDCCTEIPFLFPTHASPRPHTHTGLPSVTFSLHFPLLCGYIMHLLGAKRRALLFPAYNPVSSVRATTASPLSPYLQSKHEPVVRKTVAPGTCAALICPQIPCHAEITGGKISNPAQIENSCHLLLACFSFPAMSTVHQSPVAPCYVAHDECCPCCVYTVEKKTGGAGGREGGIIA